MSKTQRMSLIAEFLEHVPDPTCKCKHGKSAHYKHDGCKKCVSDFCHVVGCFCMEFVHRPPRVRPSRLGLTSVNRRAR